MSSIENRVVSITFDNAGFESAIANTLAGLEDLKGSLDFSSAKDPFAQLKDAASGFSLDNIGAAVDDINSKFSALGAVGFTAVQSLTQSAINAGGRIASALVDPIVQGGIKRSLAIEQARFQFKGLGQDVEASMASALEAVRGTAYGLDEAATVAAQFGASGIKAGDDMTGSLRGVAGVAALTGSSFADIGNIFTSMAGQGKLTGAGLFSFSTRGINMAAALAEQMGTTEVAVRDMVSRGEIGFAQFASMVDAAFGEHATKANETYTGSLANLRAAFSRLGAEIASPTFAGLRVIFNTLSPVIDSVHESLMPLIAAYKRLVFVFGIKVASFLEDLDFTKFTRLISKIGPQVDKIFTNLWRALKSVLGPIKDAFSEIFPTPTIHRITELVKQFKQFTKSLKLGDETADNLKRTFAGVFAVFSIVGNVLKNVFGLIFAVLPGVGGGFLSFTAKIGDALVALNDFLVGGGRITDFFKAVGAAVSTFVGNLDFSSVLGFVTSAITGLVDAVKRLFGGMDSVSVGSNRVSDRLSSLGKVAKTVGDAWDWLVEKFQGLLDALQPVIDWLKDLGTRILDSIKSGFKSGDFSTLLDLVNVGLLAGLVVMFKKFIDGGVLNAMTGGLVDHLKELLGGATDAFNRFGEETKSDALLKIAKAIAILTVSLLVLALIDSAALARALGAVTVSMVELVGAFYALNKIADDDEAEKLNTLAGGLIKLGIALIAMAFAVKILSGLKAEELLTGLVGVLGIIAILSLALEPLTAPEATEGLGKASIKIALLAGALMLMGLAVAQLGALSVTELMKGLTGLVVVLTALAVFLNSEGMQDMNNKGLKLFFVGAGLNVIAKAVTTFGEMPWQVMARGLAGIAAGLIIVTLALKYMDPATLAEAGIALILISGALIVMGFAVERMGALGWEYIARGLFGIAGVMAIVTLALKQMDPSTLAQAGLSLLLISAALVVVSVAIERIGALGWEEIARGLFGIAGALLAMALAANSMNGSIGGALAMVVVAGGLIVMARAIEEFSDLGWADLTFGLLGIAAAITVLGLAALILTPIIPSLIGLGLALIPMAFGLMITADAIEAFSKLGFGKVASGAAAIGLALLILGAAALLITVAIPSLVLLGIALVTMGIGVAAFGAGALMAATAMAAFAAAGLGAVAVIVALAVALISLLPMLGAAMAEMTLAYLGGLVKGSPEIISGLVTLLEAAIDAIKQVMPQWGEVVIVMIQTFLDVLTAQGPMLIEAGFRMVILFLTGIRNNIGQIVTVVGEIIAAFLTALAAQVQPIILAAASLIINFLQGLRQAIPNIVIAAAEVAVAFLQGLAQALPNIIVAAAEVIVAFLTGLAQELPRIVESAAMFMIAFMDGLAIQLPAIIASAATLVVSFLQGLTEHLPEVIATAAEFIATFLTGLAQNIGGIVTAGATLIINFLNGIAANMGGVITAGTTLIVSFMNGIAANIGRIIQAGVNIIIKFIEGIRSAAHQITEAAATTVIGMVNDLADSIDAHAEDLNAAMGRLASTMLHALGKAIKDGVGAIGSALQTMVGNAWDSVSGPIAGIFNRKRGGIADGLSSALTSGLDNYAITSSLSNVTDTVVTQFSNAAERITFILDNMSEFNPTITPVLDLSGVMNEATKLGSILDPASLSADISLGQARVISNEAGISSANVEALAAVRGPTEIKFEQTINAPTELSPSDIYRQTNTQIALAKEELKLL
jgi:tape measure domain-containing protein